MRITLIHSVVFVALVCAYSSIYSAVKHIIFDVGNVLFTYDPQTIKNAYKDPTIRPFHPIKTMHTFVWSLANKKDAEGNKLYTLYILSNWSSRAFNLLKSHYPEFVALFDGVVISGQVHMSKPDVAIYEHLLATYNLNPAHCVFFDDQQVNIDAAEQCGIMGVLFNEAHMKTGEMPQVVIA